MQIKRILLTGDDGYNALGTRLLIHFLKKNFEVRIAGTMTQQSGVGGYISYKEGGAWEEGEVDGVPGIWVSGHPVDAVEVAQAYFDTPFDLVISGINWGANISGSYITSGTMAAALRCFFVGLAPKAIAISWHLTPELWHLADTTKEDMSRYMDYPGAIAYKVIMKTVKEDLWGAPFVNINLPSAPSTKARFTKFLPDITKFYKYPLTLDREKKVYTYRNAFFDKPGNDISLDTNAMLSGFIAITPCGKDLLDNAAYARLSNKTFSLEE